MHESSLVEQLEAAKRLNEALQEKLDDLELNEERLFEQKLHKMEALVKIADEEYLLSYDKLQKSDQYLFSVDSRQIVAEITCDLVRTIDELEREKRHLEEEVKDLKDRCEQYIADINNLETRNEALEETFEMVQATSPTPIEVSNGGN